jgi:hypothetical protein
VVHSREELQRETEWSKSQHLSTSYLVETLSFQIMLAAYRCQFRSVVTICITIISSDKRQRQAEGDPKQAFEGDAKWGHGLEASEFWLEDIFLMNRETLILLPISTFRTRVTK